MYNKTLGLTSLFLSYPGNAVVVQVTIWLGHALDTCGG